MRLFGAALLLALAVQEPLRLAGDELKPGLHAVYRSLEAEVPPLERVDARPAFAPGHSSPHPRIPPGRFEVVWSGVLLLVDADAILFDAWVGGDLKLEVAGQTFLEGRGETDTSRVRASRPMELRPGMHRFRAAFRSLAGVPARLQIGWEGKTFSREPLPPWRLRHAPGELAESARKEALVEKGRAAVERLGCARCHAGAFPGITAPPQGPSLADAGRRMNRAWLVRWLEEPHQTRAGARMPALFPEGRKGLVERWIVADALVRSTGEGERRAGAAPGDHRLGRREFVGAGCAACHFLPDMDRDEQPALDRIPIDGLHDRLSQAELVAFLQNPHARYPDGRMPRIPLPIDMAQNIAAYLLLWSKPAAPDAPLPEPVQPREIEEVARRFRSEGAGRGLLREKRCAQCHAGLGDSAPAEVAIRKPAGCLTGAAGPRFTLDADTKKSVEAYLGMAAHERHPAPFEDRRRLLERYGCGRCHARDTDRPPPIEEAASTLGGAYMQYVPFLRTPRLTDPLSKYTRSYLAGAIRDGVSGVRHNRFWYRMPSFGAEAETILQALAEAEGGIAALPEPGAPAPADPTLANVGPSLVGFEGYSCVSCHLWNGQMMNEPDPGAIGPELTSATRRIRRDWFDRWLEDPARLQPGTPMPAVFKKNHAATVKSFLEGDAAKQRDAVWAYLSKGKEAPSPKPLPPLPVTTPPPGSAPVVAQIPVILPDKRVIESISVLYPTHDLAIYDLGTHRLDSVWVGARLLRQARGRIRTYTVQGTPVPLGAQTARPGLFAGYDRLPDGVQLRTKDAAAQTIRLAGRKLSWDAVAIDLPAAQGPPPLETVVLSDPGKPEGSLERPGYRAIAYPRPKTVSGEDLVMPGAIAAHPRDGRIFVGSMKLGELFVLRDPKDDGKEARWEDYGGGLFQEAYSMLAESDGIYVLHRRNLTKVMEEGGKAVRFDRVLALPHGVADTYDYGYGLPRDKTGAFVFSYAPYANRTMTGSGSMLRVLPGEKPEEVAFGFRNPVGWCAGPEGEIFFTDNQGEWVATNKLCHIVPGRYYGFPNPEQRHHAQKPMVRASVWVPYGWAQSINGVTYDSTGGKFGPFAGQIFMAELMYGGAIVRANLERVNGEMQGACFPFWGKGLMGPLVFAFDPKGRMWVGSITEPGWMAQPDRGAVYRIDFTGETPFEIREIRALPRGFRLVFTLPVEAKGAADPASYSVEHWRYEYTGAYGSPELDRTRVAVERTELSADGRTVDLTLPPLVKDRVYLIAARGVRSGKGEPLVHPAGAYTLNQIPR